MSTRRGSSTTSGALAWQRLKQSVAETEPKDLVKLVVIAICVILVYIQFAACYKKLENPTITSHTELKQNTTMHYPSLTICREPGYNKKYFDKYNMKDTHLNSYPLVTQWSDFPFENYTVEGFFNETVYSQVVVRLHGLGARLNSTSITSRLYLTLGLCHTVLPLNYTELVGKAHGLSVSLNHDLYDYRPRIDPVPGWHVFLHEPREVFSENTELLAGRQDHLFVRAGEEVEVNLDTVEFRTIKNCNNSYKYSNTECEENCWIANVTKIVNCTAPWFTTIKKPICNNYEDMVEIYRQTVGMIHMNCCLPHCTIRQYRTSVVSRMTLSSTPLTSTIYVYFTSKAILSMEESYAYDWNLFIADLGGSLGFLLGLSVIGVVSVLEEVVKLIWGTRQQQNGNKSEDDERSVNSNSSVYKWKFDTPYFKVTPAATNEKTSRY